MTAKQFEAIATHLRIPPEKREDGKTDRQTWIATVVKNVLGEEMSEAQIAVLLGHLNSKTAVDKPTAYDQDTLEAIMLLDEATRKSYFQDVEQKLKEFLAGVALPKKSGTRGPTS